LASGHRRYGHEQVQILRRIAELSHQGHQVGKLIAEYQSGRLPPELAPQGSEQEGGGVKVGEFVRLLWSGDVAGGDAYFVRWAQQLGQPDLIEFFIVPALIETGEGWFRRECDIYQERCVSGFLRQKLANMIEEARRDNNDPLHTIIVGTVQGDRHEGGVLILNYLLERARWRVFNLGVDLPVREFQRAVKAWHPDALGLSFVLSRNIQKRFQELAQIHGLPIFVGGRSILNYQGLARRCGLIPLVGASPLAVNQLVSEFVRWARAH
jgi:hypothetical protein